MGTHFIAGGSGSGEGGADEEGYCVAVLAVIDAQGRRVELTTERWQHIVDDRVGHPEFAGIGTI